jgi:hypothetical protein
MRAMFEGIHDLVGNPTKPATAEDVAQVRATSGPTKVGEREIHEAVLSCVRARRQLLSTVAT